MHYSKHRKNNSIGHSRSFTLIELLVVIAIIGVLSSVVLVSLNSAKAKARDARRLSDMKQIKAALEMYYISNGRYPDSDGGGSGGWDTPGNGDFIASLKNNGFLSVNFSDPLTNDAFGNYAYYRYPAGGYGDKAFYVLGIKDMEGSGNPYPSSPGWSCPTRIWQTEFEWVTGNFE